MNTIQIEYTRPYHTSFGTIKPAGFRTIMEETMARAIVASGAAKIYTASDLKADARRSLDEMQMSRDMQMIDPPPPRTLCQRIKAVFNP